jgi:hypothetical protein
MMGVMDKPVTRQGLALLGICDHDFTKAMYLERRRGDWKAKVVAWCEHCGVAQETLLGDGEQPA